MRGRLIFVAIAFFGASCTPDAVDPLPRAFVGYPVVIDKHCRNGKANIYDECSDQLAIFNAALVRANSDGKVLLVSYGAEWCIWCHVFDAYINGGRKKFRYTYGTPEEPEARYTQTIYERESRDIAEADALRDFVSKNFVVAHIDAQYAPNGEGVLEPTGADQHYDNTIPFIFAVDHTGRYGMNLTHRVVEKRRDTDDWYRGYDRYKLIEQLVLMRNAASTTTK